MRQNLLIAAVLLLSTAPATPAGAQQAGSIEIGGFWKYTHFDKSFGTLRKVDYVEGGGGRLGLFFNRHWEIEADGSANENDAEDFFKGYRGVDLPYYPFHLRLNFNQKFGESFSWLIGAGGNYNRYGGSAAGTPSFKGGDWGIAGITGFRLHLLRWLALRVDGTIDYIPSPNNGKSAVVSQGTGITASSPPTKNTNLGATAGLSILLGMCHRDRDGITITPTSTSILTSGTATFSATATHCGKPDAVVYTVSGPGTVDASGHYTPRGPGKATVTACGQQNKVCSSASVTVTAPPPPPPPTPPRTVTRCEVTPVPATPRIDQPVTYTVTCYYSDGTSEVVSAYTVQAPGADVAGTTTSFSTPGTKTVTVTRREGPPLTTTVVVQRLDVVVGDSAFFKVDKTDIYRMQDQQRLNEVAKLLNEHPEIKLVIDGHADADGTVKHNARLGTSRATSVRDYLAAHGAPISKMTVILRSFGECRPVAPNKTAAGRGANRRVEIHEFGKTQPEPGNPTCKEAGRERKP